MALGHHAAASTTRDEECHALLRQLQQGLLVTHAKARHVAEAKALGAKAAKLCASRRQAQGIKDYADALKLLGIRPIDNDRLRHKPQTKNGVE